MGILMIILGIIFLLVSVMQLTGTQYSISFAPGTALIGGSLIFFGIIL